MALLFDMYQSGSFPGYAFTSNPQSGGFHGIYYTITRIPGGAPSGNDSILFHAIPTSNIVEDIGGADWARAISWGPTPQGSSIFVCYRVKFRSPLVWKRAQDEGRGHWKASIYGDTCEQPPHQPTRCITFDRRGGDDPVDRALFFAVQNIGCEGVDCATSPRPAHVLNQWSHIQVQYQSSSTINTADAVLRCWVNNNLQGSPTGITPDPFILRTSGWHPSTCGSAGIRWGAGTFEPINEDGALDVEWADYQVHDSFVSGWFLTGANTPSFTSASVATFTVGTAGTFAVTTSPAATSITRTGTLPAGVTFVNNGSTATISGTPAAGTGGVYNLVLTATNASGSSIQNFTLTVRQAPVITSANNATFTVGQAGTFTVTTTGFPAASISRGGVALPSGVTFVSNGNGTGTLSGTPAAGTGGTYAITFTATNPAGSTAPQAFTLTVRQAPAVTSANNATFTVGTPGTFTVTTSGFPTPSLTRGGVALPSGITFTDNGNGTGTLSGTPGAGTGAAYAITFTATNAVGSSAAQSFTLTIRQVPAITSANSTTFSEGLAGSFTVTTSGFPVPTIGRTGTLPTGVTFTDNGNGTGTLAGTPTQSGTFPLTFTPTNAAGSGSGQAFTLTVNATPAPPTITSANATTFTVGVAGTFTVTTSGSPTPSISRGGAALPSGVTFTDNGNGTGTLSGIAAVGTGGTYAITFTATNVNGSSSAQSFTLTVRQVPQITSANNATFTTGAPGSFTVTATGSPTPAITVSGSLPTGVTFSNGVLSGTPASGQGGTYALTFTATNAAGSANQAFTLTVRQAPAITSANSTIFTAGTAGTFTITTAGFPVPSISRGGVALPTGMSFVDNGNGTATLSGTPALGTGGTYALTFTATNVAGSSPVQSFTMTVRQVPAITSVGSAVFEIGVFESFTVTTTGFPTAAIARTGSLPTGITFVDNGNGTGTLSGTAATGTGGNYPLTFTATNVAGSSLPQSFSLSVFTPAPGAPMFTSAASVNFLVGSAGTFTVTTSPAATSIIRCGSLPTGVTFTDNGNGTATIAGTPAAGTGAIYDLNFTATNVSGSAIQAFTLTVRQSPAITSANSTTFTVGAAGSFTVTATGFPAPSISRGGVSLPTGVTFVNNGDGTGTLSGVPAAGTGGTYSITFTATNAVGSTAPQSFTLTVRQAPAITSANTTAFAAGVPGTFTVTTTGFPVPSIARSGTLPSGVTFTDNGNGTGTLAGTSAVGTGGVYNLAFTASNIAGSSPQQVFTLVVSEDSPDPPVFTSAPSTSFVAGVGGTFNVTTSPSAETIVRSGALPAGVTFVDNGNGTGVLSGLPVVGTGGTYVFNLVATNDGGVAVQTFTLTIFEIPLFTSAITVTFLEGQAGTFTVTASGFPAPTLALTSGSLPAGVTFTAGTGVLAGTPTEDGTFALEFTATNSAGSDTQDFTLIVLPIPDPPDCTFGVAPQSESFPAEGGSDTIAVAASAPTCAWTAIATVPWILIDIVGGTGSGSTTYTVEENEGPARAGAIIIGGNVVTITQAAPIVDPPEPPEPPEPTPEPPGPTPTVTEFAEEFTNPSPQVALESKFKKRRGRGE